MKLYGVPLSQPFRSVAWTMLQLQLPFQIEMAVPGMTSKVGTRHDTFRKLTPYRSTQIPLLSYLCEDNNNEEKHVVISESPAIMIHLCEKFGSTGNSSMQFLLYPPTGSIAKAHVDSYLHWHHSNTRLLARLFQIKVRPDLNVTMSEQDHIQLNEVLHNLDSGWLHQNYNHSDMKFIGGVDHPTIADILAYEELCTVTMTNLLKIDDEYPTLKNWMKEMSQLPFHDSIHQCLDVLGDLSSSSEGGIPIAKRLGAATKAGTQGILKAQESYRTVNSLSN